MDSRLKLADRLDAIVTRAGRLAGWIIIPLIIVIMFDVITRKIDVTRLYFSEITQQTGFSVSTILQDLQWHFHALLLLFTFGVGYLANAHVRVDIFREMLSRRKQAWVEVFGLVVLATPFLVLMIWFSWTMVSIAFVQGEGSESLTGMPYRFIPKSFMVFGFLLAFGAVIATLLRVWKVIFGNQEQQDYALSKLAIFPDQSAAELEAARKAAEEALERERLEQGAQQ